MTVTDEGRDAHCSPDFHVSRNITIVCRQRGEAMTKSMNRRDLMKTAASVGLGFASVVRLQAQAPDNIPTWKRELRQLAPNVYAYMLGGGPGQLAQGVSNAGLIVAEDHLTALDSTGAPIHAKGFL